MTDAELVARYSRPHTYAEERLRMKLHPKQSGVLKATFPLDRRKSRESARCSNEVGKTRRILTAAILYAIEILEAQVISTAGVWLQISEQLIPSLKMHQHRFPEWDFQSDSIKVDGHNRYVGFSARDEGFAQGFHRDEGRPLFAAVDEAAAVDGSIIRSIEDRCNPDYFLVMGSPLDPVGAFYDIETKQSAEYGHHHINQMDCLKENGYWLDRADIDRKIRKWGAQSQFVLSNVFGEFSESVQNAIITLGEFDACMSSPLVWNKRMSDRHAFFDFAAGRDKNVFALRVGNKCWIVKKWVDKNTMSACGEFLALYRQAHKEYGLLPEEIDGDADGLGGPMIDRLDQMGLTINRFHGGSGPRFNQEYENEISEVWGEGAGKMKRKEIIVEPDEEFKPQATTRKISRPEGLFRVESKETMAKRQLPSPDEADALFGCMMPKRVMSGRMVMGERDQLENTKSTYGTDNGANEPEPVQPGAWFG